MKLVNIAEKNKIVSVGSTVLMPGMTMEIDEATANLPSVRALVGKGFLQIIKSAPKKTVKAEEEEPELEPEVVEEVEVTTEPEPEVVEEESVPAPKRKRGQRSTSK